MWKEAQRASLDCGKSLVKCRGCLIGAVNAGEVQNFRPAPPASAKLCVRCHRPGRKIVRGLICVSCANREYEAAKGRDRKGNRPKTIVHLSNVELIVIAERSRAAVLRVGSKAEAVLGVLLRSVEPIFVTPVLQVQSELWVPPPPRIEAVPVIRKPPRPGRPAVLAALDLFS